MTTTPSRSPLASSSVHRHLLRGVVGLLAVLGAILLLGVLGPASLVLLLVAVVAWRGCPTCWAVGMMGTLSYRRATAPACTRR
jgi:membrane protein DedA with SNARE-associated domain